MRTSQPMDCRGKARQDSKEKRDEDIHSPLSHPTEQETERKSKDQTTGKP